MTKKILIIEDDKSVAQLVSTYFLNEKWNVNVIHNGEDGLENAYENSYDLIVLDLMLPKLSGLEFIKEYRLEFNTPVIMLTARITEIDIVKGLDLGADDYVTKPIKPKVFISKVKGLLRRLKKENNLTSIIEIGKLIIDNDEYKVKVSGQSLSLPKKEFELLYLLASKPEKVFKREKIMQFIWGSDVVVGDRTIDVHMRKLREKIGDKYFKTIKGVGYKFVNPDK